MARDHHESNERVEDLIEALRSLPGNKIVTLVTATEQPFQIDVKDDGSLGYDEMHGLVFRAKLATAMAESGGMTVRQFLKLKVERVMPSGKKMWIPRKNVYGIRLGQDTWQALPAEAMRQAHCTDAQTGKPIPQEQDVSFVDFPSS